MFHVKQILKIFFLIIWSKGYSQQMLMFKDAEIPKPKAVEQTVLKNGIKARPGFTNSLF